MRNIFFMMMAMLNVWEPTYAADYLKCSHSGLPDVHVALNITMAEAVKDSRTSPEWFRTHQWGNMSCLYGSFVADMSACAPAAGGYGFSAPTGYAPLVDVGRRWQDVGSHDGGVFQFELSPTAIDMNGGFSGTDYVNYWKFHIDRLTGNAVLVTTKEWAELMNKPEKEETTTYTCEKTDRKF